MRTLAAVLVVLMGCGGGDAVPAVYAEADAGAPDAGCVQCEGEDGAQFAESTLAWAPVSCSRVCP